MKMSSTLFFYKSLWCPMLSVIVGSYVAIQAVDGGGEKSRHYQNCQQHLK